MPRPWPPQFVAVLTTSHPIETPAFSTVVRPAHSLEASKSAAVPSTMRPVTVPADAAVSRRGLDCLAVPHSPAPRSKQQERELGRITQQHGDK